MNQHFNIPKPCNANWDEMKIGLNSRFCESCSKDVKDFTKMSRLEILEYLLENYNKSVCGHIKRGQLDFSNTDFLVTINALSKRTQNSNLSFYLLTFGALVLSGCGDGSIKNRSQQSISSDLVNIEASLVDSIEIQEDCKNNPNQDSKFVLDDEAYFGGIEMVGEIDGEIAIVDRVAASQDGPFTYVEKMPEFIGGIDSLMQFLTENINYPEWEKDNNIEGVVFASFIVTKTGEIEEPKISKSVNNAKNFDAEVLRVIKNMPNWIPGEHKEEKVDVIFNLPVRFNLQKNN